MIDELTPADWAALEYCGPRGVPLSVFLGRVVYPGDPLWEERDTWAAMEWLIQDRSRCSGCGQPRAESQAVEAPDYEVTVTRCKACEARDAKMREFTEDGGSTSGLFFSVAKVVADGNVPVRS